MKAQIIIDPENIFRDGEIVPGAVTGLFRLVRESEFSIVLDGELNDDVRDLLSNEGIVFDQKSDRLEVIENRISGMGWKCFVSSILDDEYVHRTASIRRETRETKIDLSVDLDGSGKGNLKTGIPFFDHMLDQIRKHSRIDIDLVADGDLQVDEHHTVEDVAIVLGEAVRKALGDKMGINRYGFDLLTMDDVLSQVALDFSGRPYFIYDVKFARENVGTFPTEMVQHFFKSFSDSSGCNLNMKVSEGNTHHQIEALFKCFARALRMAVYRKPGSRELPSTKGML